MPRVVVLPRQKYDWDRWFARKTPIELTKGVDFSTSARSFVVYARQVARDRGLRISVNVVNQGTTVRLVVAGKSVR